MDRRKICFLSVAFLLGMAASEYRLAFLWFCLILYAFAWLFALKREYGRWQKGAMLWMAVFLLAASFGIAKSRYAQAFRARYEPYLADGISCLIQGEIYRREIKDEDNLFYLKDCKVQFGQKEYSCNSILLYLNAGEYFIGEILCVKGTVRTFSLPANEGNYNERAYYRSMGIDFAVQGEKVLLSRGTKNHVAQWLFGIREKLKQSYERAMPKEDAGVLWAMALGDKSRMDKARKNLYQASGISHFYSISGLHISMLGMALFHALRKLKGGYLSAGGIAAAFLLGYGGMIGFGVSASRAIGMFFLLLYAKYRGRCYDRPTALALLAALLAGKNPGFLHHAGFLLSFGAVFGVILAEQVFLQEKENEKRDAPLFCRAAKALWETFLLSMCIQLVTIPVLCMFFYEIPVYAAAVNLVILPCMGILLGFGLLGGLSGCLFPFAGKLLLFPCHLLLRMFDAACVCSGQLPVASLLTGVMPAARVLLWYGLILAALFVWKMGKKRQILALLLFLPFGLLFLPGERRAFEMDVLDVGQGDGIFLSMEDGTAMFLDGGSSSIKKAGEYRILPFLKYKGIRRIDYWFVSHCDEDHISGLRELMAQGYPIQTLAVSFYMPEDEAWHALQMLADKHGIGIVRMKRGDALKGKNGAWSMTCLSLEGQGVPEDRNGSSLALLLSHQGFSGFFAGDLAKEQEECLAREWQLPKVDVYKASHHGSNGSNSKELLAELSPKLAVISCGLKNRYGHPGKEAYARLEQTCGKIYETRFLGQIKIGANLEAEGICVLK